MVTRLYLPSEVDDWWVSWNAPAHLKTFQLIIVYQFRSRNEQIMCNWLKNPCCRKTGLTFYNIIISTEKLQFAKSPHWFQQTIQVYRAAGCVWYSTIFFFFRVGTATQSQPFTSFRPGSIRRLCRWTSQHTIRTSPSVPIWARNHLLRINLKSTTCWTQ